MGPTHAVDVNIADGPVPVDVVSAQLDPPLFAGG
jgi:hypothetical protein